MKNIRINNIECRKYHNQSFYEIVLWISNPNYNKWYVGDLSSFTSPEYCSTIAFLHKKEDWYLESVGSRICDLNDEDLSDFMKVYKKANKKLNKNG